MRAFLIVFLLAGLAHGENHRSKTVILDFEKEDGAQGAQNLRETPTPTDDQDVSEAQLRYLNRVESVYLFNLPD